MDECQLRLLNEASAVLNGTSTAFTQEEANRIQLDFLHSESYVAAPFICQADVLPMTKCLSLKQLRSVVQRKWNLIPPQDQDIILNFCTEYILNEDPNTSIELSVEISNILLEMIKYEWPERFTDLFPNFVASLADTPNHVRIKIMIFLSIIMNEVLNPTVFTSRTASRFAFEIHANIDHFGEILNATLAIDDPTVVQHALSLIQLVLKLLAVNDVLSANLYRRVSELAAIQPLAAVSIFSEMIEKLPPTPEGYSMVTSMIPIYTQDYKDFDDAFLVSYLSGLTAILTTFLSLAQDPANAAMLSHGLQFAYGISMETQNEVVLEGCFELWHAVLSMAFFFQPEFLVPLLDPLRQFYIARMPAPFEIMPTINQFDLERFKYIKASPDSIFMPARDGLIKLISIDAQAMFAAFIDRFQVKLSDEAICNLCYAVAESQPCIVSRDRGDALESEFMSHFLPALTAILQENDRDRLMMSYSLLYIGQRYTNFLKRTPEVLRSFVHKSLELLELHNALLQVMAAHTLKEIGMRCKPKFLEVLPGETIPLLINILNKIPSFMHNLCIDALGIVFQLIAALVKMSIQSNPEMLGAISTILISTFDTTNVVQMLMVLKCQRIMLKTFHPNYEHLLKDFIPPLLGVYASIAEKLASTPDGADINRLRALKSAIISVTPFSPEACNLFVGDYMNSPFRVAKTLKWVAKIVPFPVDTAMMLFQTTMDMINGDFYTMHAFRKAQVLLLSNILNARAVVPINLVFWFAQHPNNISSRGIQLIHDLIEIQKDNDAFFDENAPAIVQFGFDRLGENFKQASRFLWMIFFNEPISKRSANIAMKLMEMYPNIDPNAVLQVTEALNLPHCDSTPPPAFIEALKDFMVKSGMLSPRDPSVFNLYIERVKLEFSTREEITNDTIMNFQNQIMAVSI